ncbi:unnamed protein product, partial [Ilex paraguariensis]
FGGHRGEQQMIGGYGVRTRVLIGVNDYGKQQNQNTVTNLTGRKEMRAKTLRSKRERGVEECFR